MGGVSSSPRPALSPEVLAALRAEVEQLVRDNKVVVFTQNQSIGESIWNWVTEKALKVVLENYRVIDLDEHPQGPKIQEILDEMTGATRPPRIFINGACIGGGDEAIRCLLNGRLAELARQ